MNYQQNQNMQQNQGVNQYQEKLRLAYNLFSSGVKDYKSFSLELALDKFEKVDKIIKEAYPHIKNNPNLKETTDKFQRQVTQYLLKNQIKSKIIILQEIIISIIIFKKIIIIVIIQILIIIKIIILKQIIIKKMIKQ